MAQPNPEWDSRTGRKLPFVLSLKCHQETLSVRYQNVFPKMAVNSAPKIYGLFAKMDQSKNLSPDFRPTSLLDRKMFLSGILVINYKIFFSVFRFFAKFGFFSDFFKISRRIISNCYKCKGKIFLNLRVMSQSLNDSSLSREKINYWKNFKILQIFNNKRFRGIWTGRPGPADWTGALL